MGTDRETLYKQSMQHARDMRAKITRRQMLQISAAMAAAAGVGVAPKWARSSDTNGPGWYTDDSLEGDVVAYTFAGQRWGLPLEAVVGTFKERFPNVNVKIIAEPVGEAYTKMQVYAASKSDSYNCAINDHNVMSSIGTIGTPLNLDEWLAEDQGWLDDYHADVPANVTVGYNFPQNPDGHHASIAFDSNTKLMYYRQDKFDEAGITSVPTTWEETIEVCKALHDPDNDIYGFVTTGRRGLFAGLELYQMIRFLRWRLVRRELGAAVQHGDRPQGVHHAAQADGVSPSDHDERDGRGGELGARQGLRRVRADGVGHLGAAGSKLHGSPRALPLGCRARRRDTGEQAGTADGRLRLLCQQLRPTTNGPRSSGSST